MFNNEVTPYGTPIIQRININNNTVGELISAIEKLVKIPNNKAFMWIMGEERPVGIISAISGPSGIIINTSEEGPMPPPVPALYFIKGLQSESHGNKDTKIFIQIKNNKQVKNISGVRLEKLDEDLYIITIEPGDYISNIQSIDDAEVDAPYNSEDILNGLIKLSNLSHRPELKKDILCCHIPSIRNKYVQDDEIADTIGTICVIDAVRMKQRHLELDLMSISHDELDAMQINPGQQSAETIAQKCMDFGKGLPLFFLYKGKPYGATEFTAIDGKPPTLTLEPWADIDENNNCEILKIAKRFKSNFI